LQILERQSSGKERKFIFSGAPAEHATLSSFAIAGRDPVLLVAAAGKLFVLDCLTGETLCKVEILCKTVNVAAAISMDESRNMVFVKTANCLAAVSLVIQPEMSVHVLWRAQPAADDQFGSIALFDHRIVTSSHQRVEIFERDSGKLVGGGRIEFKDVEHHASHRVFFLRSVGCQLALAQLFGSADGRWKQHCSDKHSTPTNAMRMARKSKASHARTAMFVNACLMLPLLAYIPLGPQVYEINRKVDDYY
jgi:hypothetical protein